MGIHSFLQSCKAPQIIMRVLVVLSPFLLGASLANNFLNKLIPDVDFDNEECAGDACFLRNQVLSIDRAKTEPSTNLAYNERSLAYVNTQKLLDACLPKVAKEAVADSFTSCNDKKMEDVCVFAKRGWLVKDSQNETVENLALLTTAFTGLAGGDEAVKKCLKIKEKEEELDDYYYYDYSDYYDDYDYLEEGEVMEVRRKREAGNGGKGKKGKGGRNANKGKGKKGKGNRNANKGKKGKKGNGNRNANKGGKGKKGKGNRNAKNGKKGKKGKGNRNAKKGKNGKKGENGKKGKGNRNAKKGKKGKKGKGNRNAKGKGKKEKKGKGNGDRKFVKWKDTSNKPSEEIKEKNTDKVNTRLSKLGFSKIPKKSTLSNLECIWEKLEDLLVECGENKISNSP